jgi:hypothetical protein
MIPSMTALLTRISKIPFVSQAMADRADLSAFRGKPSPRVILGVSAIAFSFVLGWPMVSLFGVLSVTFDNPWILVAGGPAVYGLSHLVFMIGMFLSGAEYSLVFFRWLTRVTMESLLDRFRV